jgi:hypothetical protein
MFVLALGRSRVSRWAASTSEIVVERVRGDTVAWMNPEPPSDVLRDAPAVTLTPPTVARSRRTTVWRFILGGLAVLLVVLYVAASRYQPLSIRPSWEDSGPLSPSRVVKVSLATPLSNTGPFGVSVLALHPKVYADPPVVVDPLMPCVHIKGYVRECAQDAHGLMIGNAFHPFALSGGNSLPVAWQFSFSCQPRSGGSWISGPVEVRVTYRFAWFEHSVMLVLANTQTTGSSACRWKS